MGPSLPIVLSEGVLDGTDVVLLAVRVVESGELLTSEPLGGVRVGVLHISCGREVGQVAYLEVEIVLALLVELGGSDIKTDLDLSSVTGLLDGLSKELEGLLGTGDVRGETSFITDVGG